MGTHPIFESDFDCLTECFGVRWRVYRYGFCPGHNRSAVMNERDPGAAKSFDRADGNGSSSIPIITRNIRPGTRSTIGANRRGKRIRKWQTTRTMWPSSVKNTKAQRLCVYLTRKKANDTIITIIGGRG